MNIDPLFKTYEDQCWDSIVASKKLFQSNQGKANLEFYESLKLKLNTKINHEYKNVIKSDDLAKDQLNMLN